MSAYHHTVITNHDSRSDGPLIEANPNGELRAPTYQESPSTSSSLINAGSIQVTLCQGTMSFIHSLRALRNTKAVQAPLCSPALRRFHATPACSTDGVYRDLTNMRVRTPWVEALRQQREKGSDPTKTSSTPATPLDRYLTPKKMSESFHRVVRANSLT